jgi:glucosamine 6-phosphate synthetase-like amidotransferase/phosphosugar isomerase protein
MKFEQSNNTINGDVNNIAGNMYKAGRDININSPHDNGTDAVDLLKELRILIEKEDFDTEEKESVVDDIEVITEQIESEQPNKTRVKKAWERLTKFATQIPVAVEGAVKIKETVEQIYPKLQILFDGLPQLPFIG